MKIYVVDFTRWPGYEEYKEVVGLFSSLELAKAAIPFDLQWKKHVPDHEGTYAVDENDDTWGIFPITVDAPIIATYATWEEDQ